MLRKRQSWPMLPVFLAIFGLLFATAVASTTHEHNELGNDKCVVCHTIHLPYTAAQAKIELARSTQSHHQTGELSENHGLDGPISPGNPRSPPAA